MTDEERDRERRALHAVEHAAETGNESDPWFPTPYLLAQMLDARIAREKELMEELAQSEQRRVELEEGLLEALLWIESQPDGDDGTKGMVEYRVRNLLSTHSKEEKK